MPPPGLPDRSGRHPPALGGQRKNHRILPRILHCHGQGGHCQYLLRLLGHVGALFEAHPPKLLRGPAYPRPFPHRRQYEQSARPSPRRGNRPHETRGTRPCPEEVPLAVAPAQREPGRRTALPATRSPPLQPQDRPRLPSQGSLSATLGVQFARLGRQVPRRVVPPDHAIPHRTHEEDRPFATQPPRTHPELFPRPKAAFQWRRGGLEQQGESHYEKIVRLPHLPRPRTRPLSLTWQATRTRFYPRFLLTSPTGHIKKATLIGVQEIPSSNLGSPINLINSLEDSSEYIGN